MNRVAEARRPLLSIWIPTFNRADRLERLLESLYSQSSEFVDSGLLEIVVSDNCSQDSTEQLCEELFENLDYRRREVNMGFDRNFSLGFSECVGEFIWTIGDDDFVLPGAIADVVGTLMDRRRVEDISLLKLPVKKIGDSQETWPDTLTPADGYLELGAAEAISTFGLDELMRMSSSIYRRAVSKGSDKNPGRRGWNVSPLEHALFALGHGKLLFLPQPYVVCNEGPDHREAWQSEWQFIANVAMPFVLLENRAILQRKHRAKIPVLFFRKGYSIASLSNAYTNMRVWQRLRLLTAIFRDFRLYQSLIGWALQSLRR